jgi:hypothetical protein
MDIDHSFGLSKRERSNKNSIHDTEDGCVRTDAEAKSNDGNQGETGPVAQHARCVFKILPQCLHLHHVFPIADCRLPIGLRPLIFDLW